MRPPSKAHRPTIHFEDDHLIVVDKPADVLSIPDRFDKNIFNIAGFLAANYPSVFTVHRLDKPTSGIMIFAKTAEAHAHLSKQFQERTTKKTYWALVDGHPPAEREIDKPIGYHPTIPGKMMVTARGKSALSRFVVEEQFRRFSSLAVTIETGRTHQIRVHLASIGFPLAVDELYGAREGLFLSEIKGRNFRLAKNEDERPLVGRASLHAWKLTVVHPATGETMTFSTDLPKDLAAAQKQLRKLDRMRD